jgi:(1->4)-alpha-D-glucan 1-alpha-D-glucosylmutase
VPPGERELSPARAIIPRATYRIQLNASFTFRDATALVPYLAELGISHVYCSPYFRARPGSTHGYDVVDHNSFNPEIGTREDFERFVQALRAHDMGQILDIVPNHVGIMGADNARWMDVLENGQASACAEFFDIDWEPADPTLSGKVLVPVLGEPYGIILERGELRPQFEAESGSFAIRYHEHRFPLNPRTYPCIIERAIQLVPQGATTPEHLAEFESLAAAFRHLPTRDSATPEQIAERARDKEIHKRRLAALCAASPPLLQAIEQALRELAGKPDDPSSFDALHDLLEHQAYRLAYWRVASDEINYRRFFDVNDLAALRMENDAVFESVHALVMELVAQGKIQGLRIDHPDGLNDPLRYFQQIQERAAKALNVEMSSDGPQRQLPIYLLAEKITAGFEHLPENWPVHGTTGYRFANLATGLLVDASAKSRMDRIYHSFVGNVPSWENAAYEAKQLILRTSLAAELNVLANQLVRIARSNRRTRDFTLNNLRNGLREVIACFPVYRTYIAESISEDDLRYIDWAIKCARKRASGIDEAVFGFIRSALVNEVHTFARKFQQVTAPVTAKGVEDTALYRFIRLVALNEVGGEPDAFGVSVRAFHADCQHRAKHWPHEMLATSTHDTKRSEDVRARIAVLSEGPALWRRTVLRWRRVNRLRKREIDDQKAPSAHDEYLFYQTLVGTWPLQEPDEEALGTYIGRIEEYLIKAAREAKLRTSWTNPDAEYEDALRQFVRATLEKREGNPLLSELIASGRIARFGLFNALSQVACKLATPGVPDIYQGTELWDFSLVDPDNRRPVDYELRRRLLAEIRNGVSPRALVESIEDGRAKLFLIWKLLQLRRTHEALFRDGEYLPLRVSGARAAHLCAFARKHQHTLLIVLVPRLYARLVGDQDVLPLGEPVWRDTAVELPRGSKASTFSNVLGGGSCSSQARESRRVLHVADALANFPVAALLSDNPAPAA